jgi:hypothetical protein
MYRFVVSVTVVNEFIEQLLQLSCSFFFYQEITSSYCGCISSTSCRFISSLLKGYSSAESVGQILL